MGFQCIEIKLHAVARPLRRDHETFLDTQRSGRATAWSLISRHWKPIEHDTL